MISKFVLIGLTVVIISCILYKPDLKQTALEQLQNYLNEFYFSEVPVRTSHSDNDVNAVIPNLYTASELKHYSGENNGKIYLSILGSVFDVTKGKKYYGVGQNYHGFAGRDASRAFVTGDFSEDGLIDDISELSLNDLADLKEWHKKYEEDYTYKGKLIGRFYDKFGNPTEYLKNIENKLVTHYDNKKTEDVYKVRYPPCNAEWTPETGSRVWCSRLSGGIKRNWIGFPRKFHQPGSGTSRCACVNLKDKEMKSGNFEVYENCDPNAVSCNLNKK